MVEQRRDRSPTAAIRSTGTRSCWRMLEEANPGGRSGTPPRKTARSSPMASFEGMTIFEARRAKAAARRAAAGARLSADRRRVAAPNIHEDTATGDHFSTDGQFGGSAQLPEHKVWFFHLARICNHCTYPGCLASCPRNAIYKRPEDGIVLIDQSRCRGYRKCVEGCPYKKAMYRPTTRTSEKCVGCFPRIEGKDPTRQPDRCAGRDALHVGLRRQDPPAGAGEDRPTTARGPRSAESALLPDSRAASCPAAVSAVRHRAQRLLHSAALGAARLPDPDVRPRRRSRHRAIQLPRPRTAGRAATVPRQPADRLSLRDRTRARRSAKSKSRCPTARRRRRNCSTTP